MLALAVLLLTIAVGAVVGGYALLLHHEHRRMSGIPGPPRSSFFSGNLDAIVSARKKGIIFDEVRLQWHIQYGYTTVIFVFHKYFLSCIDPSIIKHVILQNPRAYPKSPNYHRLGYLFGERGLGEGIITQTDYDTWAMQRLALNPAFHRKFLINLVPGFNATAASLTDSLSDFSGTGRSVDLSEYLQRATNDVISQLAFGLPPAALHTDNGPLMKAAAGMLRGFSLILKSVFSDWSPFFRAQRNEYKSHVRAIKAAATQAIRERMTALQEKEEVPDDILSTIVKAHAENPLFTMDLMLDNMVSFFVAGQETSANALAFVLMELEKNPQVLQKVVDEIQSCIGSKPVVSYEDTCSMKYCTMVIKETLRLHSIAPGTFRYFKESATFGDTKFPAGTIVMFSAYSCGRHPDFHKEPELFNPDRFDPEVEERIPQVSYFPFSLGPRSCIGQNFAMIEMKIILAKFLQRFEYRHDISRPFVVEQASTLRPRDGFWVTLHDRLV